MPTLTLTEQDLLVCHLCWQDVFVAVITQDGGDRFVLVNRDPHHIIGDYVFTGGPSKYGPRFAPRPSEATSGTFYSAHYLQCRKYPPDYRAEAARWLNVPDLRGARGES